MKEVYVVAFFKVMQQQTIGKVANSKFDVYGKTISVCNSKRIIKIVQYLQKLWSTKNGPIFLTHSVFTTWCNGNLCPCSVSKVRSSFIFVYKRLSYATNGRGAEPRDFGF